jgi:hypothetical protein
VYRVTKYLIATVLILCTFLYWSGKEMVIRGKKLKDARIELDVAQGQYDALKKRVDDAAQVRQDGKKYRIEVVNEANKTDWGSLPVPIGVADKLCAKTHCAERSGAVPTSNNKPGK